MNKKIYSAPEAEIEKFSIIIDCMTLSWEEGLDDSQNNGSMGDGEGEF